ncbi:MAG: hypothetical protein KDA95_11100, partial [Acidimicrobiales bacterium]|nr:hypothetical protein [Acidimicrobiales bacterium]
MADVSDATSDPTPSLSDWEALATKDLKGRSPNDLTRTRPEGIDVKALYTADDIEDLDTDTLPGFAPFTRGVRATMYANRPWTIRQYAGF